MLDKFLNIFRIPDLRKKLIFTGLLLLVYRLGGKVPIPGIDKTALASMMQGYANSLLGLYDMFAGGFFSQASIFALGIMPYISASIIIQLLGAVVPYFQRLQKEGEEGRKKIIQLTRYGTVLISSLQATGMAVFLSSQTTNVGPVVPNANFAFYFGAVVSLVTGTMFLMWLGEQINERGIGNGISMLIFAGIVAGLPGAIGSTVEQARTGELHVLALMGIAALIIVVTFFVVWVERGQRRIVVNYAKRQQGRKVFAAQSSHLPLKVNMAGVIPAIFATAIIMFPGSIMQWIGQGNEDLGWLRDITVQLQPGNPLYIILYAIGIIFFCFFYTALTMNPRETADNLKKSGAFIPGIRPGEQTSKYIDKVMTRLTLAGALYVTFVCLMPEFLILFTQVPFYFGGTSLLIIVVVVMDFMAQVQSHLMSRNYDSVLKKANFKNYGAAGQIR